MTTAGSRWGIVMSRDAGYSNQVFHFFILVIVHAEICTCRAYNFHLLQVVELDFLYPSEGIHRRWENGYRITSAAATTDQAAFILSSSKKRSQDVTQETLRTSAFPSTHVKVLFVFVRYLNFFLYGR